MAERKKRSLLLRINIAAAISLFGGSLALATWGGIVLNQNKIESEYLKKTLPQSSKIGIKKGHHKVQEKWSGQTKSTKATQKQPISAEFRLTKLSRI